MTTLNNNEPNISSCEVKQQQLTEHSMHYFIIGSEFFLFALLYGTGRNKSHCLITFTVTTQGDKVDDTMRLQLSDKDKLLNERQCTTNETWMTNKFVQWWTGEVSEVVNVQVESSRVDHLIWLPAWSDIHLILFISLFRLWMLHEFPNKLHSFERTKCSILMDNNRETERERERDLHTKETLFSK